MPPKGKKKSLGGSGGGGDDGRDGGIDGYGDDAGRPRICPKPLLFARERAVARFSRALLGRGLVSRKGAIVILADVVAVEEKMLPVPPPACSLKLTDPCKANAPGGGSVGSRGCATHCVCQAAGKRGICAAGLASHLDVNSALLLANKSLSELGLALRKCRCEQTGALYVAAVNELSDDIATRAAARAREGWHMQLFIWFFRQLTEGRIAQERCAGTGAPASAV